jgi:hypothetical protein
MAFTVKVFVTKWITPFSLKPRLNISTIARYIIPLAVEATLPGFLGVIRCQNSPCNNVNPGICTSKRKSNTITNSTTSNTTSNTMCTTPTLDTGWGSQSLLDTSRTS